MPRSREEELGIIANTKIDQHMTDCTAFRLTVQNTVKEIKDDITELRIDIKSINWRMALIMGAITFAGKALDFFIPIFRHSP